MNEINRVLNTLKNIDNPQKVVRHASECISAFPALNPAVGRLPRTDGTTSEVFCLSGTIPIYFRGSRYNVPIAIFLEPQYPSFPPRFFVTPPSTMYIRPDHQNVNVLGTVKCPLLDDWKPASSSLVSVCQQLSLIFGSDPPCSSGTPPPAVAVRIQLLKANILAGKTKSAPAQRPVANTCHGPAIPQPPAPQKDNRIILGQLTALINKEAMEELAANKLKLSTMIKEREAAAMAACDVESSTILLRSKIEELKAQLAKEQELTASMQSLVDTNSSSEIDLDTIYNPTNIVAQQMNVSLANDYAIEDALYALNTKLGEGLIDFEDYINYERRLARMQFMERAMVRQAKIVLTQK